MTEQAQEATPPAPEPPASRLKRLLPYFAERDGPDRAGLAALRRMREEAPPAIFWRLLARAGVAFESDEILVRWVVVLRGLALLAPNVQGRLYFGQALARNGVPAPQVEKLLSARDGALRDLMERLFRRLAGRIATPEEAFKWQRPVTLLLEDGRHEDRANAVRIKIARDYYSESFRIDRERSAA